MMRAAFRVMGGEAPVATTQPAAQEGRTRDLQRAIDTNSRLVAAAEPILDPQQLEQYRIMLDRQVQQARLLMDVTNK